MPRSISSMRFVAERLPFSSRCFDGRGGVVGGLGCGSFAGFCRRDAAKRRALPGDSTSSVRVYEGLSSGFWHAESVPIAGNRRALSPAQHRDSGHCAAFGGHWLVDARWLSGLCGGFCDANPSRTRRCEAEHNTDGGVGADGRGTLPAIGATGRSPVPKRTSKGMPFYDYELLRQIADVLRRGVGISGEEVSFYRRKPKRPKTGNPRTRREQPQTKTRTSPP